VKESHRLPLVKGEIVMAVAITVSLVFAGWSLRGEPMHFCRDAVRAPVCEVRQ
jgi:hypothetical protein